MSLRSTALIILFLLCCIVLQPAQAFLSEEVTLPSLEGSRQEVESRVRAFDKLTMMRLRRMVQKADALEQEEQLPEAQELRDKIEQWQRAILQSYEEALELHSDSAILNNFYAELLHDRLGLSGDAGKHWRRAISLDPGYGRAQNNLGLLYCHEGRYEEGLKHLDLSLDAEPDNPDFLFNTVQVYLIHSDAVMMAKKINPAEVYKRAMAMSERAVRNAPDAFDLLKDYALNFFMAEKFESKPNWKKAAQAWQDARKQARSKEELFNTWLYESRAHIRNKNISAARKCLNEAAVIWPESPVVKNMLKGLEENF
jgi:tetratricopeptide (TPR) repeat protein